MVDLLQALQNGAYIELVHLSPLERMVIHLCKEEIENEVGLGSVLSTLVRRWIGHICATQIHKFLTSTAPLEPISSLGRGFSDLVVLPWEALKNGEDMKKAIRSGLSSLTSVVAFQTLTTTSRVAHTVAGTVARVASHASSPVSDPVCLASRPLRVPRHIYDAAPHLVESVNRGLQTANHKIVIVPYREYRRSGATGAVKSILKGIPVAIAAPASGAVEALSYALLSTRNQIQPDVRREEESSLRGLHF
jgi:autophagy-related protein 2